MSRIGELGEAAIAARLEGTGLPLDFGAARVRVFSDHLPLAVAMTQVYRDYPVFEGESAFTVTAAVRRASGVRRLLRAQIRFVVDGDAPFEPFPAETHLPLLEWGLNWCIANRSHHRLMLHAGVVARDGLAVLLPAYPGSGKSTLTAALMLSGWRLLSDEFGVLNPAEPAVLHPLLRPVALKNESIDVIRAMYPGAAIGPAFPRTRKGTVAHIAPARACIDSCHRGATARLVVFPKYDSSGGLEIEPVAKARAFVKLAGNAFNYETLGPQAFHAVRAVVDRCDCYQLRYRRLDDALAAINGFLRGIAPASQPLQPARAQADGDSTAYASQAGSSAAAPASPTLQ